MMEMDFMLNAGQALNKMRLTLEGATTFFETDLSGHYREALAAGRTDEALALDMLGTALNELRREVAELQAVVVNSNICNRHHNSG